MFGNFEYPGTRGKIYRVLEYLIVEYFGITSFDLLNDFNTNIGRKIKQFNY